MIGRFIIECDPAHLDIAKQAIEYLQQHPETDDVMSTSVGMKKDVHMFATRLKKSIRVRQVKP